MARTGYRGRKSNAGGGCDVADLLIFLRSTEIFFHGDASLCFSLVGSWGYLKGPNNECTDFVVIHSTDAFTTAVANRDTIILPSTYIP